MFWGLSKTKKNHKNQGGEKEPKSHMKIRQVGLIIISPSKTKKA